MQDETPTDELAGPQRKQPSASAKAVGVVLGVVLVTLVAVIVLGLLARAAIWVWSGVL